jgi:NDP-sugar pyrophosphorylase family protein
LAKAIAKGEKVFSYIDRGLQWFETGDPKNYLEATRLCLACLNQNSSTSRFLESVLKRFSPGWDNYKREKVFSPQPLSDQVLIKAEAQGLIGRGVSLSPGCQLKDFFVLGEGSRMAEGAQIEASVLFPHQSVGKDEKLYSTLK